MAFTLALRSQARQHHLTLNTLIRGVWALLLGRYSGESDVVFGATLSGRPTELAGVESMVGLFINTLPERIKISPEASLWPWLKDIQTQSIEQGAYEYCSAGQVHQWSEVPASVPLFESILVFENYPSDSLVAQSSDSTIDIHNTGSIGAHTQYALTILVIPRSELELQIVYQSHRFDDPSIIRILDHFLELLHSIVAEPEQHLETIIGRIPTNQIQSKSPVQIRAFGNDLGEMEEVSVAPRSPSEEMLAGIWAEILGLKRVGIHDNLFALGGHSLLATQIV